MLRPDAGASTEQGGAPEDGGHWNGAAALVVILAAQLQGAVLVLAVACFQSTVARIWTVAATAVLLITTGVLFQLGDDEQVLARSLLTVAACLLMILLDTVAASLKRPPSLLCTGVFGSFISFAVIVPVMVADPNDFAPLWASLYRSHAVETVQWMTLVGVVSFGAGLLASRLFLAPLERLWAAVWDTRLVFAEQDGGFTLAGIVVVGIGAFLLKISLVGYGYLASGEVPLSLTWVFSGVFFIYYLALYAANARMLAHRRLHLPTVLLDVVALAYEIASGSKGRFAIYVLFPLMLVAVFQRRRLSFPAAGGLAGLILGAVLIVYPLLVSYRSELTRSVDPGRPQAALMMRATGSWSDSYSDKMALAFSQAGPAEQVLSSTAIVFFDVRRDAGRLWQRLAFFWVPRALWPDKAEATSGSDLGRESHRLNPHEETSILTSGVGALYVYLGSGGAIGFFLTGLLFRFVDVACSCFRAPQSLRIGASVYLFQEVPGVVGGDYETGTMMPLASTVILLTLFYLMALAARTFSGARRVSLDGTGVHAAGGVER